MQSGMTRRAFAAGAALLPMACAPAGKTLLSPAFPSSSRDAINPLVRQRADAQIFRHEDGLYYMMATAPEYDRLLIRRSPALAGLSDPASETVVWRRPASGKLAGNIWAPELFWFDGVWHIYFGAGSAAAPYDIRIYVLTCRDADPLKGTWELLGQLETPWDTFTLDPTLFVHRGTRYACWAQREPGIDTNSNIYLAPLATATTLARPPVRLTVPTFDWEIPGYKVNEGPALLARNGGLFLTYSAAATDSNYCLGMLSAREDADIMDPQAWTKAPRPVFKTCHETQVFGPGHNSFTVDEQGRDMLVYLGRDYEHIPGDPLGDPNRHTRIQRLYFDAQGNPDFGVPVGNGPLPERFSPAARPGIWLAHEGTRLFTGTAPLPQTQFRSLPAGSGTVRLSPILLRDKCLVATGPGSLRIAAPEEASGTPRADAFRRVPGPEKDSIRLESVAFPGKAIAASTDSLALADANDAATLWRVA